MKGIRIALFAFGIAAFVSSGGIACADQLVGVTKASDLIGKKVKNLEGKDLG